MSPTLASFTLSYSLGKGGKEAKLINSLTTLSFFCFLAPSTPHTQTRMTSLVGF